MNNSYSDLQVVPGQQYPKYLSTVVPQEPFASDKIAVQAHVYGTEKYADAEQARPAAQHRDKTCGLSRRWFWIVIAVVAIIIIAGAVGGGVGATMSGKSDADGASLGQSSTVTSTGTGLGTETSTASTASATSSSTLSLSTQLSTTQSATPTSESSTATLSTSTILGPSGTIYVDCPSSNDTIYTPPSSTQMFRKICGTSLLNVNNEYAPVIVQVTTLNDCISSCAAFNTRYAADIAAGTKEICNAACWRSADGDYGGWCYGYTTQNTTGSFNLGVDTRCNSAALINQ